MAQAGINPLLFGDPTAQATLDQLQRQQQYAQTLLEQSQTSPQGQMVGDRYVRPSWTQGLGQLLKAYMGRQGVDQAAQDMAKVQANAYAALLAKNGGAPQQGGATGGSAGSASAAGIPGANYADVLTRAQLGDPAALKQLEWFAPPDAVRLAAAAGTSPQVAASGALAKANTAPGVLEAQQSGLTDAQIQALEFAKRLKEGTDPTVYRRQQSGFSPQQIFGAEVGAAAKEAEIDRKNGNAFVNPFLGTSGIVPKIPDNAQASQGVDQFGNPVGGVVGIPGAQAVVGANTRSAEANKILTNVEGPGGVKFTGYGSQFAGGGGGAPAAAPAQLGAPGASPAVVSPAGAPQQPVRYPGFAGADPLVQKTREGQIALMQKDFEPQFQRSSNAQGTINNLQQIMGYAQGARTGQMSDKLRLVDSVLSMMGSQDATQRQIAGDLLGKNANQIVARLGNGDMGTDAARQILISAYPNAKMMSEAIEEAAQNLIAQQHLVRARTQILSPKYSGGDFQGYNETAQQFDALADPRIFQWKAMPNGPAKDAYRAAITKQDPTLMQKAKALAELGVK